MSELQTREQMLSGLSGVTDIVDLLKKVDHVQYKTGWQSKYLATDAIREITRLRQLLSEAEKREREARAKALEEAAAYHDDLAAQHAASHEHVVSDHHEMMERQHTRFAAAIRALQSEER